MTLHFAVPSKVQNLTIVDDDTHLIISWVEPAQLNGIVTYIRSIICEDLFDGSIILNETVILPVVTPAIISRQPYTLCSVTVTPQTGAGLGNASDESYKTPEEGS